MGETQVKRWQRFVGTGADGHFGPKTTEASARMVMSLAQYEPQEWSLGDDSLKKLEDTRLDQRLTHVVRRAAVDCPFPFAVFETLRTREQQRINIRRGVSWTMNSKHLVGKAVDIVPLQDGQFEWKNYLAYKMIAFYMLEAAHELQVYDLKNGGLSWGRDWYHFEVA